MEFGQLFQLTGEYRVYLQRKIRGNHRVGIERVKLQALLVNPCCCRISTGSTCPSRGRKSDISCSKWWCKGTELMCRKESLSVCKRAGSTRFLVSEDADGMKTGWSRRRSWWKMISRWKECQTKGEHNFQREAEEERGWTTTSGQWKLLESRQYRSAAGRMALGQSEEKRQRMKWWHRSWRC